MSLGHPARIAAARDGVAIVIQTPRALSACAQHLTLQALALCADPDGWRGTSGDQEAAVLTDWDIECVGAVVKLAYEHDLVARCGEQTPGLVVIDERSSAVLVSELRAPTVAVLRTPASAFYTGLLLESGIGGIEGNAPMPAITEGLSLALRGRTVFVRADGEIVERVREERAGLVALSESFAAHQPTSDMLRVAIHAVLSAAAESIEAVDHSPGIERRPERYAEPVARFRRTAALLDAIAWGRTGDIGAFSTSIHGVALVEALHVAVCHAEMALEDAVGAPMTRLNELEGIEQQLRSMLTRAERQAAIVAAFWRSAGGRVAQRPVSG